MFAFTTRWTLPKLCPYAKTLDQLISVYISTSPSSLLHLPSNGFQTPRVPLDNHLHPHPSQSRPLRSRLTTHLARPPRPLFRPHHPRRSHRQLDLHPPRRKTHALDREAEIARGQKHEHTATGSVYRARRSYSAREDRSGGIGPAESDSSRGGAQG